MKSIFTLSLLIGTISSIKLQGLPWEDNEWFEHNNSEVGTHLDTYKNARAGIPWGEGVTSQEDYKINIRDKANEGKKPTDWVPSEHDKDDTGSTYYDNWKCFGKECEKDKDTKWTKKRQYVS